MPTPPSKTTQDFVPIKEIRQGVAVLKDGSLRGIVMCSSINFALKSFEEQQSILNQFQSFLNGLDFSIQIFIQSRKLDIRPYIALLEGRLKEQVSELLKIQTREYIKFIKDFSEKQNIMTKTFFVVVPYSPTIVSGSSNPLSSFLGGNNTSTATNATDKKIEIFEEHRSQLEQRMGMIEQGLAGCGVRTAELGTEEIVELFYKIFNPGDTEKPIPLN
jgi:type IV secretory pathway VirB4 component